MCHFSTIVENGSSVPTESESPINDESDISFNRSLVNRRIPKKSLSNNSLPPTKRKVSIRSMPSLSSVPTKPILPSSTYPLSTTSHSSSIVKPFQIELPHSLVDVVVNWNLPMHYWLKIYIYMPMKQQYGHFSSILVTYLASALLHGFNFQLSIVLFSIGLFAYVEYGFRRKLATILDACVAARSCPLRSSCDKHTYTYWHPLTIIVNIFLCLLSLWHLTYLGQLFDGSSQETIGYSWQHVIDKWAKLNFASHLVVIGTYAIFRSL
jgi:porcupine-like protein